jgi:hypothetical protein
MRRRLCAVSARTSIYLKRPDPPSFSQSWNNEPNLASERGQLLTSPWLHRPRQLVAGNAYRQPQSNWLRREERGDQRSLFADRDEWLLRHLPPILLRFVVMSLMLLVSAASARKVQPANRGDAVKLDLSVGRRRAASSAAALKPRTKMSRVVKEGGTLPGSPAPRTTLSRPCRVSIQLQV